VPFELEVIGKNIAANGLLSIINGLILNWPLILIGLIDKKIVKSA